MATLVPQFSGHDPYNFGIAETYSYIPIANDVNRPIYAKASYITNFEDLAVSLSTGDINIGSVHILDNTNGLTVSIANVGLGGVDSNKGAMRVLTQDFESDVDDITIGDRNKNYASVNAATSALNVFTVNGISAVSLTNQITSVSITNQLTGITVLNPVTAVDIFSLTTYVNLITSNQNTEITLQKTLTANNATAANQVTTNSLLNSLTANVATATNQVSTNTLLNSITANQATSVNQLGTNTLLNSVTANQGIEITLQKALTANNATQANQVSTNTLLNSITANQATQISLSNSLTSLATNIDTVLFSVTANQVTQITLGKTLSSNSVYGTLSAQPLFVTLPTNAPLQVTYADSVQLDQNGRLRVAQQGQEWWYVNAVDKDGDYKYIESFVAGASSIFVQNLASVNLTSGTTSVSGKAIRMSRKRHRVRPGTSHHYTCSLNWDGKQDNVLKRVGMYTSFNGMFWELSGSNFNTVIRRRLVDGTLVEERVNSTAFNGDKLDGTGPSGENWDNTTASAILSSWISTTPVTISSVLSSSVWNVVYSLSSSDISKFRQGTKATITGCSPVAYNTTVNISNFDTLTNRITATYIFNPGVSASSVVGSQMYQTSYHMQHSLWYDFLGGRTNRVRFGKYSDYGNIVLHTYHFDNQLGTQFENAPALPERREIQNYGAVTSLPSFTLDGSSYSTESNSELNPIFGTAYNTNGITTSVGYDQPILGIALRPGEPFQRADVQIQNVEIIDTANRQTGGITQQNAAIIQWKLILNPGLSGVPASTDIGKATRQWNYTSTTDITSRGIELLGGFVNSSTPIDIATALNFINAGSNIEYTDSDRFILTGKVIAAGSNTASLIATMNYIELV